MKIFRLALLALFLVLAASAADVTGTWDGTFKITTPDGQTQDDTVHLVLKQSGGAITGTAGPNADQQVPIGKGTIEGNKVVLEVPVPDGMFKFDVVLDGDHLKGDAVRTAGGSSMKAKMDATRAK
ncbi:MAG: hypothetical protein JWP63_1966 [Candidatus Solibacter sp.]|jgi:hypothetical protein|nr:hypothetical protein [Candidatus Solibacter sp.]